MHEKAPNEKAGFTLAELLVVILIMGILFSVSLPVFTNLTGQSKLEAAANTLHSAAKLARQHAMAQNQPAYLLFHDSATDPEQAYRSFAVYTIDIHTRPVTANSGYYLKNWELLPEGVIFDPLSNASENLFTVGTESWKGGLNKNNELKVDGITYITLGFKPSGEISSATHHIHLAQGTVLSGQPQIYNPGPGKQIHFTTFGKSFILDTLYGETEGDFTMLGEPKSE